MLRETVTVSFGDVNSAVNATWEYGDFDRKLVTNNACSDLCFDNVLHTLQLRNFLWLPSIHECIELQRHLHDTMQWEISEWMKLFNTLRPRQNERRFADDIFKCIYLNGNVWISIKISLNFVPQGPINNIPALVQIMAWRRPGDKPLSGPMVVSLPTHICVIRPQWVNISWIRDLCGVSIAIPSTGCAVFPKIIERSPKKTYLIPTDGIVILNAFTWHRY